jgi:hypothetical protein
MVHACSSSATISFTTRFEIHAERCPHALARVTGLLATYALLPQDLHARQSCGGLWLRFDAELDRAPAERIAERLRALVPVSAVILIHPPREADRETVGHASFEAPMSCLRIAADPEATFDSVEPQAALS